MVLLSLFHIKLNNFFFVNYVEPMIYEFGTLSIFARNASSYC